MSNILPHALHKGHLAVAHEIAGGYLFNDQSHGHLPHNKKKVMAISNSSSYSSDNELLKKLLNKSPHMSTASQNYYFFRKGKLTKLIE